MVNKKQTKKNNPENALLKKGTGNRLPILICVAIIAIVTYFVFSPSLKNELTTFDDDTYVTNNSLVVNDTVKLGGIFQTPIAINYHPLTILSLAWNYQMGKLNPEGYHLENVLIHILNSILVFFFILLITRRNLLMAGIAGLFFGIHPMHVESVAWVSERKDVLYVFFFLSGLITYLRYRETHKTAWYIFTLVLFIFSCLSKGMAVIFPLILLLIDYLQNEKWDRKLFVEKIPFFVLSIGFGITAFLIQRKMGAMGLTRLLNIYQRVEFSSYGTIMYIVKFFFPVNLAMLYPYPIFQDGHEPLIVHLSPFIFLAIIAVTYFFFRKEKPIVFGLLFFFFSIVMVIQFFPVGNAVMADRYSYLSYIGLLYAFAYLFNKVWQLKSGSIAALKYPLAIIVFVVAIMFSAQTYSRTQVWKSTATLWTDELSKYPYVTPMYEKYYHANAFYYQSVKQYDKALVDWNSALILNANDTIALINRANFYYRQQEYDLALEDYNRVTELFPKDTSAYENMAVSFVQKKDFVNAERNFAIAIKLDSNRETSHFNRGLFYNETNQDEKALADFKKCLQLSPKNDTIYNWVGVSSHRLKRYAEAITNFSKAIDLNPKAGQYWLNRSFSENALNKKDEAGRDALKAQELGAPVDINYLKFLGLK